MASVPEAMQRLRTQEGAACTGALVGLNVLELSQFVAGPVCGCILADHGADVLKIERPGGEDARQIGPFINGESLYYATYNRNKRAMCLDLKAEEGREVFLKLAASADAIVENYRPGVLDRLGIGYEDVRKVNPKIVFVSISGFGQTGPSRNVPAFDQIVQALSGVMYLGGDEGAPPQKMGISISDYAAGLQGAIGGLLALFARERTGRGQRVDVSLFDSLAFMLETSVATFAATQKRPIRVGNGRPGSVPGNSYRCADGWAYIAATSDRIWARMITALDPATAAALVAFPLNSDRVCARVQVDGIIGDWCSEKSVTTVVNLLGAAGVPCAPVRHIEDLLTDEQVIERRTVESMDHPVMGLHVVPGVPVKLTGTPGGIRRRAALAGEHTSEVLLELGVSEQLIAEMREAGIV